MSFIVISVILSTSTVSTSTLSPTILPSLSPTIEPIPCAQLGDGTDPAGTVFNQLEVLNNYTNITDSPFFVGQHVHVHNKWKHIGPNDHGFPYEAFSVTVYVHTVSIDPYNVITLGCNTIYTSTTSSAWFTGVEIIHYTSVTLSPTTSIPTISPSTSIPTISPTTSLPTLSPTFSPTRVCAADFASNCHLDACVDTDIRFFFCTATCCNWVASDTTVSPSSAPVYSTSISPTTSAPIHLPPSPPIIPTARMPHQSNKRGIRISIIIVCVVVSVFIVAALVALAFASKSGYSRVKTVPF